MQGLVHYAAALARGVTALPAPRGAGPGLNDALLASNGLTPPRSELARTADDAAAKAAAIGFPVAVKIVSPQASHKTEVGGVSLHLADAAAVRTAATAMAARLARHDPTAIIEGFLVQEMVDGLEMIVGVREDPLYGPFMVAGLGGVLVEVLKDVAIRLLPVAEDDARDMLRSLRSAALLGRFRGRAPRDIESVVRAMVGLSRIFIDHRAGLTDIEINPMIVLAEGQGVRAVDVRTVARRTAGVEG
jgi:acetyltransferase